MTVIELRGIRKTFRIARRDAGIKNALTSLFSRKHEEIKALDDISFTVNDGEIVGYIGPNGAGKSSTIKIMSGILTPDSGSCCINGRIPWKQRKEHVREIGVVFGQRSQLWWDVPVVDSFALLKDIYRIPDDRYRKNFNTLTELLNIGDIVRAPARTLSLGQRMRCEIAASLIHSPKILFLDEPTIGLDAASKTAVRSFIKELNRTEGTTVILTTHDMQDIEALSERIILIGKGKILLDGTPAEVRRRFAAKKLLTVEFNGVLPTTLPHGMILQENTPHRAVFALEPDAASTAEIIVSLSKSAEIREFSASEAPIDDVILNMYKSYQI